ncbi:MAG TPA: hypothetical protein VGF92_20525 [Stellaceae bacterium]
MIGAVAGFRGTRGENRGLGLGDDRILQLAMRVEIGERRLLSLDRGLGLGKSGALVAVVKAQQQVAGVDGLIVGNRDLGDDTRDFGSDDGDVAADIGIVGALDEASDRPPFVAVPGRSGRQQKREGTNRHLLGTELLPRFRGIRDRNPSDHPVHFPSPTNSRRSHVDNHINMPHCKMRS